jgi:hypothetical protein
MSHIFTFISYIVDTLHFICTSVWLDSEKQYTRKFRLCLQHGSGIHSLTMTLLQCLTISAELAHFHSSDMAPVSPKRVFRLDQLGFSRMIISGSGQSLIESLGLQFHHRFFFTWSASCTICKSVTHNDCVGERSFRSGFGKFDSSD